MGEWCELSLSYISVTLMKTFTCMYSTYTEIIRVGYMKPAFLHITLLISRDARGYEGC